MLPGPAGGHVEQAAERLDLAVGFDLDEGLSCSRVEGEPRSGSDHGRLGGGRCGRGARRGWDLREAGFRSRFGCRRGGGPRLGRGLAVECLMGSFIVVVVVELVDQCLQGLDRLRGWPGVEPLLQRLVEPFVLALGCRPVRFAGDGLDPEVEQVVDQLAGEAAAGGVERQSVVGQQPLWDAPAADRGRHDQHCGFGCLAVGDEACGGEPGVVVDDLVDRHAGAISQ